MSEWIVICTAFGYLFMLFGVAYFTEKLADRGVNITNNPVIYALSMAVFCTAWTFYGSVGRASSSGVEFLTIYLGPTLSAPLWYFILKKVILISRTQRINSIADFISSRYGKNTLLGGIAATIAIIGIIPYISLQLKAISQSFEVLVKQSLYLYPTSTSNHFYQDTSFYIAILLAIFSILFGTRHLEVQQKHRGLVGVIALESLIKLVAFISVGVFVSFYLFENPAIIFQKASQNPAWQHLFHLEQNISQFWRWTWLLIVSMLAIFLLPRQFHVAVVENNQVNHVDKATWMFPLYLFLINIFVLPITFGGLLFFQGQSVDADTYVLAIPMATGHHWLALLVFCGGLSAATSMVIVATISLSIMAGNNIIIPILLQTAKVEELKENDVFNKLIHIRRLIIILIMFLSYVYYASIGKNNSLVTTGLFSFVAVAQFAPSFIGGIFWREGNIWGAAFGLLIGFIVWAYTLPIPALANTDWFNSDFIKDGPWDISLLRPYALFGLEGLDHVSHSAFWSLLLNSATYFGVSVFTRASMLEYHQADLFVNINKYVQADGNFQTWRGNAYVKDLKMLLERFIGKARAQNLLEEYAIQRGINLQKKIEADGELINLTEKWLAGAIGAASARLLITSVVQESPVSIIEVMDVMDEAQQIIKYSQELEEKSNALVMATEELKAANQRLQEMDQLKNDFIATITHELRTPITSIQSLAAIINEQNGQLNSEKQQEFLSIIIQESKRISRLINRILDLEKMESGHVDIQFVHMAVPSFLHQILDRFQPICETNNIKLIRKISDDPIFVQGDKDRLTQVIVNLLSNAIKFCHSEHGEITVSLTQNALYHMISIKDNGQGIPLEQQPYIFDKFTQFDNGKPRIRQGSGLGLSISWRIIIMHQGKIELDSKEGEGANFIVSLPKIIDN